MGLIGVTFRPGEVAGPEAVAYVITDEDGVDKVVTRPAGKPATYPGCMCRLYEDVMAYIKKGEESQPQGKLRRGERPR